MRGVLAQDDGGYMKNIVCRKCNRNYNISQSANFIVICSKCFETVHSECEYGFGPVVPCQIYVGNEKIAEIDANYQLNSDVLNIHMKLQKGYKNLEVYEEAVDFVFANLKGEK